MIEKCLVPRDRKLEQEARQLGLSLYTHKQNICIRNANNFSQDPVQVKSSNGLKFFLA